MSDHPIFSMPFARVYPHYVTKAERKGRSRAEVDEIIRWLTGYGTGALARQLQRETDFRTFFAKAPRLNPHRTLVTGVVCGVRVETVADPLMREIRVLDKLIDELAKGRAMDRILRAAPAVGGRPPATARKHPSGRQPAPRLGHGDRRDGRRTDAGVSRGKRRRSAG